MIINNNRFSTLNYSVQASLTIFHPEGFIFGSASNSYSVKMVPVQCLKHASHDNSGVLVFSATPIPPRGAV